MKKTLPLFLLVYGMWFVFILLGILFMIISRNGLNALLSLNHPEKVGDALLWSHQAQFYGQAFSFVSGFILLIVMIVVEEYFKNGVRTGNLFQRFSRVFGIEILFLLAANILLAALIGFSMLVTISLVAQLALAVGLIWLSLRRPKPASQAR